jgi:hypothetical protein
MLSLQETFCFLHEYSLSSLIFSSAPSKITVFPSWSWIFFYKKHSSLLMYYSEFKATA